MRAHTPSVNGLKKALTALPAHVHLSGCQTDYRVPGPGSGEVPLVPHDEARRLLSAMHKGLKGRFFPQISGMFGKAARAPPTAVLQSTARAPHTVSRHIMILTDSVDLKYTYPLIVVPSKVLTNMSSLCSSLGTAVCSTLSA